MDEFDDGEDVMFSVGMILEILPRVRDDIIGVNEGDDVIFPDGMKLEFLPGFGDIIGLREDVMLVDGTGLEVFRGIRLDEGGDAIFSFGIELDENLSLFTDERDSGT